MSFCRNYCGKKKEIWHKPMTKEPSSTQKSKNEHDNTINATKTSITKRLQTDLGRSVRVTTISQLVLLNQFTGNLNLLTNDKSCVMKRAHI